MKSQAAVRFIVGILVCGAAPLAAGSTIDHELATIDEVALNIVVLQGVEDALGEQSAKQLKSTVSARIKNLFENAHIRVAEDSAIWFDCHIDAEHHPELPEWSALHVQTTLVEPIRFVREVNWSPRFGPHGTTWEFSMVQIVRKAVLAEELADWAEGLAESFVGDRGMALAWRESHPGEVPK